MSEFRNSFAENVFKLKYAKFEGETTQSIPQQLRESHHSVVCHLSTWSHDTHTGVANLESAAHQLDQSCLTTTLLEELA